MKKGTTEDVAQLSRTRRGFHMLEAKNRVEASRQSIEPEKMANKLTLSELRHVKFEREL